MLRVTMVLAATAVLIGTPFERPLQAQADDLSDPEIAHIAVTANVIDVETARVALRRSDNANVRDFAQTMIRDHEGVIDQANALAGRLGVTPKTNATSRALNAGAEENRRELSQLDGRPFNLAYIDNEIAYHETVISAVRQTLIPSTENDELRSLLQAVLPALEAHLEHARRLASDRHTDR